MDFLNDGNLSNNRSDFLYEPEFFDLSKKEDQDALRRLYKSQKVTKIVDEIKSQYGELVKSQNPKRVYKRKDLEDLSKEFFAGRDSNEYGKWVFYPWSGCLVHVLDEEDFIFVRTNRNRNKITPDEQNVFRSKKIGLVGLSVGKSIALTLAMERLFDEIRIADFDILELSNLNRIRSGLHTLGLPKTTIVAREIKEMDPYLKIRCFHAGLTNENREEFFLGGSGKIDVLFEECDDISVKVSARQFAKMHEIPVIMETNDRGMLDVERFDLEPDRSIFHGFIDHLDSSALPNLKTNKEKVPYVAAIVGIETMSKRAKASFAELGQTITTWPQLASSVALGSAIAADAWRRIALGSFQSSGRYFVDLEDLINDNKDIDADKTIVETTFASLDELTLERMIEQLERLGEHLLISSNNSAPKLLQSDVETIVGAAALAPSAGNIQPWKFLFHKNVLAVFHDKARTPVFGDNDYIGTNIAIGGAIENLCLKAEQLGWMGEVTLTGDRQQENLVAMVTFQPFAHTPNNNNGTLGLVQQIEKRNTNRNLEVPEKSLPLSVVQELQFISDKSSLSAAMTIIDNKEDLDKLGRLVGFADRLRILDLEGNHNLFHHEMYYTQEGDQLRKTGIDLVDLKYSEKALLDILKDKEVIKLLNDWDAGQVFDQLSKKDIQHATAICHVKVPSYTWENYLNGGRLAQRLWLSLTKNGWGCQPMMSTVFFNTWLNHGGGRGMTDKMKDSLASIQKEYNHILKIEESDAEVFLFRITPTEKAVKKSLRLPLESILKFGKLF